MKVQFTDYQKLKDRYEVLKEINEYQNDTICRLQKQNEKMRCCSNCNGKFLSTRCKLCKDYSNWELADENN